jgi:hypothetical protein
MEVNAAGQPSGDIASAAANVHHPSPQCIGIPPVLQKRPQSLALELQQAPYARVEDGAGHCIA